MNKMKNKKETIDFGLMVLWMVILAILFIFICLQINPDKNYSDPAVYERYVEDMRSVGRKPNGEPLDGIIYYEDIENIENNF